MLPETLALASVRLKGPRSTGISRLWLAQGAPLRKSSCDPCGRLVLTRDGPMMWMKQEAARALNLKNAENSDCS